MGEESCKIILNVYGNERSLEERQFKDRFYAVCVVPVTAYGRSFGLEDAGET